MNGRHALSHTVMTFFGACASLLLGWGLDEMFVELPKWVPVLALVAGTVLLIISLIMGFRLLRAPAPETRHASPETRQRHPRYGVGVDQSVTSHNQSGGITAHTVNLATPPQRRLDDALLQDIMSRINAETVVSISYPMGDGEAATLAREIYETLKAKGVRFADYLACMAAVFENPPVGLVAERGEDVRSLHIVVGRNTG